VETKTRRATTSPMTRSRRRKKKQSWKCTISIWAWQLRDLRDLPSTPILERRKQCRRRNPGTWLRDIS